MAHKSLTPAQAELLTMLAEEASEIVRAVTKILRHGYGSFHPRRVLPPHRGITNKDALVRELKDLWAVYELIALKDDLPIIDFFESEEWREMKLAYTHYQNEEKK